MIPTNLTWTVGVVLVLTIQARKECSDADKSSLVSQLKSYIGSTFSAFTAGSTDEEKLRWFYTNVLDTDNNQMLNWREGNSIRRLVFNSSITSSALCARSYIYKCWSDELRNDITIGSFLKCNGEGMECPRVHQMGFPRYLQECQSKSDCASDEMCCNMYQGSSLKCLTGVPVNNPVGNMRQGRCPSHANLYNTQCNSRSCESDFLCTGVLKCCPNPNCNSQECIMPDMMME